MILGLAKNTRLNDLAEPLRIDTHGRFEQTASNQKLFGETLLAAKAWNRERRVIIKAEHLKKGANPMGNKCLRRPKGYRPLESHYHLRALQC